ncbi:PREDICTED: ATP synthase subunit delta, mitochondrial-like [Priapulus caudatus]|uniref:ATP synthase subunit delta, mitochondrial-like n=1 Tax=Priapulus caudatus TaxID=37621 RepID=A0ABM1E9V0_PRICU|nr:PREDICTED: ATP synthase subunit delta, mitochondrial-like [Priapulus caudatus]
MSLLKSICRSASLLRHVPRVATAGHQRWMATEATQMSFTFACPAQVFYNEANVRQVDVPSHSGSFGILPQHVPLLAVLKPGIVTVIEDADKSKKFFVSSGSVTINADSSVQVLAEEAVPLDQLDAAAIREGLSKAQQSIGAATNDQERAKVQIEVEVYEALAEASA